MDPIPFGNAVTELTVNRPPTSGVTTVVCSTLIAGIDAPSSEVLAGWLATTAALTVPSGSTVRSPDSTTRFDDDPSDVSSTVSR